MNVHEHSNFTIMYVPSSTLKQTNLSKVGRDDGLSSYMLLNINQSFVNSYILFFNMFIFNYCVVPTNFNNIHIFIPIIKDKTKSPNDSSNLRPISISNTLAQIFERLIKLKIPQLSDLGIKIKHRVHMHCL